MKSTKNKYYCQQHVCSHIDDCIRSWKNMPMGKIYETLVYHEDKNGNCKHFTIERIGENY